MRNLTQTDPETVDRLRRAQLHRASRRSRALTVPTDKRKIHSHYGMPSAEAVATAWAGHSVGRAGDVFYCPTPPPTHPPSHGPQLFSQGQAT
jgi:hypothetical protein